MMNEQDAVNLLKTVEKMGIDVWIDGGWGVDALIGRQTRPHNDIDIFIEQKHGAAIIEMLVSKGYQETKMEYTTENHTVWSDKDNRIIDLHLFEFTQEGTLCFENENYPLKMFSGKGKICGIEVRCLPAESQLLYHQGYDHDEEDVHDVRLLCEKFELPVPKEYEYAIETT